MILIWVELEGPRRKMQGKSGPDFKLPGLVRRSVPLAAYRQCMLTSMQTEMNTVREASQKRRRIIEDDEEAEEETNSQMDMYEEAGSEECEDTQMDLFTQARTQVEGVFLDEDEEEEQEEDQSNAVRLTKNGSPLERVRFNPKPSKKDVVEVRQGYAELLSNLQRINQVYPINSHPCREEEPVDGP